MAKYTGSRTRLVAAVVTTATIVREWTGNARGRTPGAWMWKRIQRVRKSRSWCRYGLEALMTNAEAAFTAATGIEVPWNHSTHGPWLSWPNHGHFTKDRDLMVETAAKAAGFLKAIAAAPAQFRLVRRLLSTGFGSGMRSPYTRVDVYTLSQRFSPGRLDRWLGNVVRRADKILAAYGLRVSWRSLATVAMNGDRRIGKAAVRAAALTIEQWCQQWIGWGMFAKCTKPMDVLIAARGLRHLVQTPIHRVRNGFRYHHYREAPSRVVDAFLSGENLLTALEAEEELKVRETTEAKIAAAVALKVPGGTDANIRRAIMQVPALVEAALVGIPAERIRSVGDEADYVAHYQRSDLQRVRPLIRALQNVDQWKINDGLCSSYVWAREFAQPGEYAHHAAERLSREAMKASTVQGTKQPLLDLAQQIEEFYMDAYLDAWETWYASDDAKEFRAVEAACRERLEARWHLAIWFIDELGCW
jgi:hypothetical protein